MSPRVPVGRSTLAVLGVLLAFVLALGTLLGCGGPRGGEVVSNASNATAQPVEEASGTEPPSNIAEAAAASVDESSIRIGLAHLMGASPAPLESGATTIADGGSEDGRKEAAGRVGESIAVADATWVITDARRASQLTSTFRETKQGTSSS